MSNLKFTLLDQPYAICRLEPRAIIPDWASGDFCSVTRTKEELSIICPEKNVPPTIKHEPNFRCVKLEGPLELSLVGILADVAQILMTAHVSVLAIGTYDTDYFLIKRDRLANAVQAIKREGHSFQIE